MGLATKSYAASVTDDNYNFDKLVGIDDSMFSANIAGTRDPYSALTSGLKPPTTNNISAFTESSYKPTSAEGSKLFGLDTGQLGNIASLGSVAVSAFGAYDQYKTNKLAQEGMKFNLASARESLARFKQSREGFNNFDSSATRIA